MSEEGIPSRLNIIRTMRSAQARRMALSATSRKRLREIEIALQDPDSADDQALLAERDRLKKRIGMVPFLDDFDLKYNLQTKVPLPSNKAVMFCVMDVSGSMDR